MSFKTPQALLGIGVCLQLLACLGGCEYAVRDGAPDPERQLKLANIRSRIFATADRDGTLRVIAATLQDLGFHVDRADYALASVSGTKLDRYLLRLTVTVIPRGTTRLLVRANARYDVTPVLEPELYQKFFATLSRALALEAQTAD
jgi:hypothetical protein